MKASKNAFMVRCVLVLMLANSSQAQTARSGLSEPVRSFVQEFYSWYVPKVLKAHGDPALDLALKYKGTMFTPELLRALKEDSDAQLKVSGEIVGLDFDPFLNTQDACEHYELGAITKNGQTFRIEVFGVCSGKRNQNPDVIAEVTRENGHCVFANFAYENLAKEYPNSANLLAILKLLREERQASKPKF